MGFTTKDVSEYFSIKTINNMDKVEEAADKAAFRNFFHAAASISKAAKKSITRSKNPSAAGSPPHTKRGQLRRSIRFAAGRAYHPTKHGAIIGPMASMVDQTGSAHEFGGIYKGGNFPKRPFMGPALDKSIPRFAGNWRGSIGG